MLVTDDRVFWEWVGCNRRWARCDGDETVGLMNKIIFYKLRKGYKNLSLVSETSLSSRSNHHLVHLSPPLPLKETT